ncbi:hypothetical protein P280DRAFT_516900 [Massarina eburnea CBS 473.64]|uniref:Uncharacterized protein n=1 Tax=Massarina eburnea CBS 473.64 TaxID=1395130 RepID=A0A6A6S1Z8_9PLEO|nr:hypothetical protein P280DRAFT_516900 [Massarina eburnea CBS 473.64]
MRLVTLVALVGLTALGWAQAFDFRRDNNCTLNLLGKGPVASPDTVYGFLNSQELASSANNAPTPSNYTQSFKNMKAATQADNYLGFVYLDSYDTNTCASNCTATPGCQGINIFFERDPSKGPSPSCTDPPSTTTIKCTLWGVGVTEKNAVNTGQTSSGFTIAMAGSNGYNNGNATNENGQGSAENTATPSLTIPLSLIFLIMANAIA